MSPDVLKRPPSYTVGTCGGRIVYQCSTITTDWGLVETSVWPSRIVIDTGAFVFCYDQLIIYRAVRFCLCFFRLLECCTLHWKGQWGRERLLCRDWTTVRWRVKILVCIFVDIQAWWSFYSVTPRDTGHYTLYIGRRFLLSHDDFIHERSFKQRSGWSVLGVGRENSVS